MMKKYEIKKLENLNLISIYLLVLLITGQEVVREQSR